MNQQKLHIKPDAHPEIKPIAVAHDRHCRERDETKRNKTKTDKALFLPVTVIAQRERERNGTMSAPEESAAQKSARLRRERREAKIRDGGAERLDKITSMSGRTPASGTSFILIYVYFYIYILFSLHCQH